MDSIRTMRGIAIAVAAVAGLSLVACGSSEDAASRASVERRAAPARTTDATPAARSTAAGNVAPVIEGVEVVPAEPTAHDTVQAQVRLADADGDRADVRYTWFVNGRRAGEGRSFDLAGTQRGATIQVSVVADDGQSESEAVTASVTLGNTPPRIDAIRFEPSGEWHAGVTVAAVPEAIDPDDDPLTFEYVWFVNGRRLDESGPTLDGGRIARGDKVQLAVVAGDGYDRSDEWVTKEVEVANAAPEIVSTPGAIGPDGVFRYQVEARDPDGDRAFMYRLVQGPPGMEVDTLGGRVLWQPREAHAGSHVIEVEVDDRMGGTATQQFTLDVTFGGNAPASPR